MRREFLIRDSDLPATAAGGAKTKEDSMGRKVFVIGVGMTKFEKPGSRVSDTRASMTRMTSSRLILLLTG